MAKVLAAVAIPIPMADGTLGVLYVDRLEGNGAGLYKHPDLRLISLFAGIFSVYLAARDRERRR